MTASQPILELKKVSKWYDLETAEGALDRLVAVDEITRKVPEGAFISIVGPSGCGKSTLLEMIAGLRTVSSGEIRLKGQIVTKPAPQIGVVFQEESTFPWRTVMGNVEFPLEIAGVPLKERRQRCQQVIELVGLREFVNARPKELSGGMRQRVAIARALAYDPDILLMDEPFGALDQQTRVFLGEELLRIWQETHKTILFVTHDINEAIFLSQEVWVMSYRPGRIRDVVQVDFPYPRGAHTMAEPGFAALSGRVWQFIHDEWQNNFSLARRMSQ